MLAHLKRPGTRTGSQRRREYRLERPALRARLSRCLQAPRLRHNHQGWPLCALVPQRRKTPESLHKLLDLAIGFALGGQQYPETVRQIAHVAPSNVCYNRDFQVAADRPSQIATEFERAVMGIKRCGLTPNRMVHLMNTISAFWQRPPQQGGRPATLRLNGWGEQATSMPLAKQIAKRRCRNTRRTRFRMPRCRFSQQR